MRRGCPTRASESAVLGLLAGAELADILAVHFPRLVGVRFAPASNRIADAALLGGVERGDRHSLPASTGALNIHAVSIARDFLKCK
jgi:hypothetical protein